ncbi:SIR2 family protein [Tannerella forsythia]|uniref:SIR2 family protein n=1 Tax=Tannerella forsythia TaxID=28112 RepID=A0A3P1XRG3_TANFO|nr:SIR2 family protein [Tannerella forsythia]RRD61434.1 SIR2 family protein [Tannerella forsythia]
MSLQNAIDLIFEGNCILFTGAGASLMAVNIKEENLKTAKQLTDLLYDKCGLQSDNNLSYAVDEYIEQHGEHELIQLLKEQYSVRTISEEQEILGSVDWKRIYTTNYDRVLETAYMKNGKHLTPVTLSDKPYDFKDKKTLAIHLNGYIDRLTPETLNGEFKLSEASYLANDFVNNDWGTLFRQDLKTSDVVFFVGFSLNHDLDLKRVIYATPELIDKCFFIMSDNENATAVRNVKKYGNPILIGLNMFTQMIKEQRKSYVPIAKSVFRPLCFSTPQEITNVPPDIKDKDFYKLLVEGSINYSILQHSVFSPNEFPYYLFREKLESTMNSIENGAKNILITSDLGNGKTLFIKGLSYLLKKLGYNVFEFTKYYATLDRELEEICSKITKPVIIVESYSHHFDILAIIKNLRSTDLVLIVSERSLTNDLVFPKYEEKLESDYHPVDLNVLTEIEMQGLVSLIDKYGLWGRYSTYHNDRKLEFISDPTKCRKNIRLLLLKLLNSPDIISRFSNVISTIQNKRNYYEAIVLLLVSKIFNFNIDLDDLVYALDDEVLNKPSFQKDPVVREFVNFDENRIVVKSAVLAETILSNVMGSRGIVDTLIKICKRLDNRRDDKNIKIILREVISFSNLQRILQKDTSEYKFNILRFFEEIRNMKHCSSNPHYWLQYAIARLSEREYELADNYFNSAYSFAKKLDWFDPYQIDNHYARHLLENEIYNGDKTTAMSQFLKAHKILSNPNDRSKTRHYPFRVAQKYYPFYEMYFSFLSKQDKIIFIHSCKEILNRIEGYMRNTEGYRIRKEVQETKLLLNQIVENNKNIKK